MISQESYEALRKEFGTRASWAVWAEPGDTPKSNTGDLSVFDSPDIATRLSTEYALVALNRAVHDGKGISIWGNFHSGYSRQNDYKLRHAFKGTPLWGCYITDVLEYEETESAKVMRKARRDPKWTADNIDRLRHELELLGGKPTLVAIGKDAERLLRDHLGSEYEILGIPHFASRKANNKDIYRGLVADALLR